MTLQIEEGKYYRAANGIKVGPTRRYTHASSSNEMAFIEVDGDGRGWSVWGRYVGLGEGFDLVAEWTDEPAKEALALLTNTPEAETFGPLDVKVEILAEAGRIVNGARRTAYGTPEMNFERIARFWQAYFENCGMKIVDTNGDEMRLSARVVSPMMRLMKEARLCETPDHYDSHVDIVGYALTGAEVNKVKSSK